MNFSIIFYKRSKVMVKLLIFLFFPFVSLAAEPRELQISDLRAHMQQLKAEHGLNVSLGMPTKPVILDERPSQRQWKLPWQEGPNPRETKKCLGRLVSNMPGQPGAPNPSLTVIRIREIWLLKRK